MIYKRKIDDDTQLFFEKKFYNKEIKEKNFLYQNRCLSDFLPIY